MDYTRAFKKTINLSLSILMFICIIATVWLMINGYDITMMFSPVIFIGLIAIMSNIKNSLARGDFITVYIIGFMALRYIPYPFFFCILKANSFYTERYAYLATLLFIIEEIVVLFVVNYGLRRIYRYNKFDIDTSQSDDSYTKTNSWLILILLILSILVYYAFPAVAVNYQFIWSVNVSAAAGSDFSSIFESFGYVIIDSTRLLLPLFVINACYRKNLNNGGSNNTYVFISFLACLLPMLLIKNMNRGSSFNTCLVYIWLVISLYGWKRCKKYTLLVIAGAIGLLAAVSAVKHAMGLSNSGFSLPYIYDMLESYTLGLESMRIGLVTNDTFSQMNPFYVLFNDIFSSVPILNRYADLSQRYTSLFNSIYYWGLYNKKDALAPLLTNMLFVFGPFGILVSFYLVSKAIKVYFKALEADSINMAFVLVYLSVVLEAGRVGSLSATVATLIWVVFPLFVFVKILDKSRVGKV